MKTSLCAAVAIAAFLLASTSIAASPSVRAPETATNADQQNAQTAAWNARVAQRLQMTEKQRAALEAYESNLDSQFAAIAGSDTDSFRRMTLPQRLEFMAQQLEANAEKLRTRANAARAFYATLTPQQQLQFDEVTLPLPPPGHPGVAADAEPFPAPAQRSYQLPSHTNPGWMVRPTADDMSRVYPSQAQQHHITGSVVLHCTADENGYLADCVVKDETPKAQGFGNAALEITAYMRMKPATDYGVPVKSEVVVPVNFSFP